jgi:diguanylate cyclase (GGDEF)-like protein
MPDTLYHSPAHSDPSEGLADKLTDFLARVSPAGDFYYISRRGAQWLERLQVPVARDGTLLDMFCADDQSGLASALADAGAGAVRELSVRIVGPDGDLVWVSCRVFRLVQRGDHVELLFAAWDISPYKLVEERLNHAALHDALTGLANRVQLRQRLGDLVRNADPEDEGLAVMHLNLDGFKKVNEALGHEAGDRLIVEAGERLKGLLRSTDLVARVGGDEFVLVLPGSRDHEGLAALARKLLNALQKPYDVARNTLHLTASMGVALYPDHGTDAAQLLDHADQALARSKELGRNRWQLYGPGGSAAVGQRVRIEELMYEAIQNGEFEMHYQPIFFADSRTLAGVEALMRWRRPGHGPIPPAEFIPIAEENGLINFLGKWSLRAACHQIAGWNRQWGSRLVASVNLSPRQFHQDDIVAVVELALAESGLAPECLSLEITEGALMHNPKAVEPVLDRMRARGVHISVDDFGTGYSSLAYLKRFPLTTLKIDYSFVRDLTTDPNDRAIVSMIVSLAREMELKVVAEGVETEAQLAFLDGKGCDLIQGFLLGRPVAPDELARRVDAGEWRLTAL